MAVFNSGTFRWQVLTSMRNVYNKKMSHQFESCEEKYRRVAQEPRFSAEMRMWHLRLPLHEHLFQECNATAPITLWYTWDPLGASFVL